MGEGASEASRRTIAWVRQRSRKHGAQRDGEQNRRARAPVPGREGSCRRELGRTCHRVGDGLPTSATFPRVRHLIALLLVPACTPLTTEPAVRAVTRDAGFTKQAPLVSQWRELGRSVEGRPIRARTVGHGPRHVLWIGGIHGDETEGTLA